MMKKLICLVLALLMVVPMLASCADDGDAMENVTNEASRYTTTLNMWVMTSDDGVDEKQAAAVNEAINKITKAKFKTKINIKYVKESEYYEKVEKALAEHEYAIENGLISKNQPNTEETIYNEYGVPELKYPEIKDYQVDILFIGDAGNISGYEKYREFADKEWILSIDDQLSDAAMKLYTYIDDLYFDAIQYNGLTYGIPNNTVIGEYTYLMVDKAWMKEYNFTTSSFPTSSLYDGNFQKFLNYIYEQNNVYGYAEGDANYVYPLYSADGVDVSFIHYWGYDLDSMPGSYILRPDEFSLFGGTYLNATLRGEQIGYENLLVNNAYIERVKTKLTFEKTEGFMTDDASANAAVKLVKGGWELQAEYADQYEILIMGAPRATEADVFGSMFAVGGSTIASDRAVEIITYLNTNAELRNLLQYGIEGVNYTLETETIDEIEYQYVVPSPDNKYVMDIEKTGNMFIAHPDCKENIMAWEYGKKQNHDAMASPTLSVFFDLNNYKIDEKSIRIIESVSDAMEAYLAANVYDESLSLTTSLTNLTEMYNTLASSRSKPDEMANKLLNYTGRNLTYTMGGVTETINNESLAKALAAITNAGSAEAPITDEKALQSPYALYLDWRLMSGVTENLPNDDGGSID